MSSPGLRWSSTSGTSPSTAIPGSSTSTSARSAARSTVPSSGLRWRRSVAWVTGSEMTRWATLPIRYRLSIMFGASAAVVVAGLSVFVYTQTAANLLATVDSGLSSRAGILASDVRDDSPAQVSVEPTLIEGTKVFAQIDDASGQVLRSTARIARSRLLSPLDARSLHRATSSDRRVSGIGDLSRVLAVPVVTRHGRLIVAVGASLQERHAELVQLAATLAIAGT